MLSRKKLRHKNRARKNRRTVGSQQPEALEQRALLTLSFKFDYSLDSRNFFDTGAKRAALERAGDILASRLNDSLDAIEPGDGNTWSVTIEHPGSGSEVTLNNLTIREDELLIYAGGRDLGSTLGHGSWGFFSWNGNSEWGDTVTYRGQASNGTDFAPQAGAITFDQDQEWHFGATVEGLDSNEFDFTTIAVHELAHTLGFAPQNESFSRYVSGGNFRGPRSVSEYDGSGNVPLHTDNNHWAENTLDNNQSTILDPTIAAGTRELPTYLDYAVLDDIGWEFDRLVNDYGDAPGPYPTAAADNGARHNLRAGLYLGVIADGDANGQDSDDADGFDDEDGVRFLDTLFAGDEVRVDVTANREAKLNAWVDLNLDGDWEDAGEQIFDDFDLEAGLNRLTFTVPATARSGQSWARFRLNSSGNLSSTGAASDGEVEDYPVNVVDGVLAIDDTSTVAAGASVNIDVTGNDIPSDRARVFSFTDPNTGTVTENADGTLSFTAAADSSGTARFDYTVGLAQDQYNGNGEGDELGRAIASFEDTLILTAPLDDTAAGASTGSVRVYRRDGLDWNLVQTITANDEEAGDRFGFSVSIHENTLVIGSRSDDDDGLNSGSAYVYQRNDTTSNFTFSQKLRASTGRERDQFGFSVAVEGDHLIVGVRMDDEGGKNSGSLEYFSRPDEGSDFAFVSRIQPDAVEKGDQFGSSLAIDGNRLFVGARKDNNAKTNAGAVYYFTRSGTNWNLVQTILPSKPEDNGYFGWSISVSGSRLAVGQPARERVSRSGKAFIHEQNEGGTNNWGVVKRIDPADANGGNRFGFSISISGTNLLVGAPRLRAEVDGPRGGDARVYARNEGGTDNWGRVRHLTADNAGGGDEYGYSVLASGEQLFVGARLEDSGATNAGAFYVDDLRTDIGRVTINIT